MPRRHHPDTPPVAGGSDLPFHLRLRFRREAAGVRQGQLAEALGVHATILSAYEYGRRAPADPTMFDAEVADALQRLQGGTPPAAIAPAAPQLEGLEEALP